MIMDHERSDGLPWILSLRII